MSAPRIRSVWQQGAEFLARFDPATRVLRPAEPVSVPSKTTVSVNLVFNDRRVEFHLHALVSDGNLEFLEEERDRLELVLTCARGESLPYFKRRHPRYPCSLPVSVRMPDGTERKTEAVDVSNGGIRLAVKEARWPVDLTIQLAIQVGDLNLKLRGRIASYCTTAIEHAVGVEFLFESAAQRSAVQQAVSSLEPTPSKAV